MQNSRALLEKDQLRIEQRRGRVFQGWNEGKIYFPPTYKYLTNSDKYTGDSLHHKEKRRTPAWCDRILWFGGGLHQLSYVRGESRFAGTRDEKAQDLLFSYVVAFLNEIKPPSLKVLKGFLGGLSRYVDRGTLETCLHLIALSLWLWLVLGTCRLSNCSNSAL